jgi:hypothetical protein
METNHADDGTVIITVRDESAWGATEFDVVMTREDISDFLRTIGGDPSPAPRVL